MKSLSAMAYAFNHVTKVQDTEKGLSEGDTRQMSETIADAMALLADTSHSLDIQRRLNFKSEFKDEFSPLCSDNYPVSDMFFGSDTVLPDKVKDVSETLKVSHRVNKRFSPYSFSHNQRKKFPFLGHRAPQYQINRGSNNYQGKNYQNNKPKTNFPQKRFQPRKHQQNQRK